MQDEMIVPAGILTFTETRKCYSENYRGHMGYFRGFSQWDAS